MFLVFFSSAKPKTFPKTKLSPNSARPRLRRLLQGLGPRRGARRVLLHGPGVQLDLPRLCGLGAGVLGPRRPRRRAGAVSFFLLFSREKKFPFFSLSLSLSLSLSFSPSLSPPFSLFFSCRGLSFVRSTEARRERFRSKGNFKLTVNELCEKLNPLPSSFFSTAALAPASSRSTRRPATEASTAPRRPSSRWPSQRKRTFPSRPSRTRSSTAAPEGRARSPSESVSFFVSFFSFVVAREGTEFLFLRERGSAALSLAGDPSSLFLD